MEIKVKRIILVSLFISILFISCHSDLLLNNGEVLTPSSATTSDDSYVSNSVSFNTEAPNNVTASPSFFTDKIIIRWNDVSGADYYTLERAEHLSDSVPENVIWTPIQESIFSNVYTDKSNLKTSVYYSYRVTAHTLDGMYGDYSEVATGTLLASPDVFEASKGTYSQEISLNWQQMPNVYTYNIYKSNYDNTTGSENELIAQVNSNSTTGTNRYSYVVTDEEKGRQLYFVIKSVGETNVLAQATNPRLGYTKVIGAPLKPEIVSVTKGTTTSKIEIEVDVSNCATEDVSFIVSKSINNGKESVIYNSENASNLASLEKLENGNYLITDQYVLENIEYKYSIILFNSIGKSEASVVSGYVLSPVQSLSLVPFKTNTDMGYELKGIWPVGFNDVERKNSGITYYYDIIQYLKNGEIVDIGLVDEEEFFSNPDYSVFKVDKDPREDEISYIAIALVSKKALSDRELSRTNGFITTNILSKLVSPVKELKIVSNCEPLPEDSPNQYGIYPLHIYFDIDSSQGLDSKEYNLVKIGTDGTVRKITLSPSLYERVGNTVKYTDLTITNPLVRYTYYIDTSDELGRTLGEELKVRTDCYPTITLSVYADIFGSLSLKPWDLPQYVPAEYKTYWKNCRIATLVGYGNASDLSTQTKALESATDYDHYRGGSVYYNAKLNGVRGSIDFAYDNFGESEYFYTTGNYHMDVSASGDGTCTTSSNGFDIKGNFPGHIGLEDIQVKSKGFSGNYNVKLIRNTIDGLSTVAVEGKVASK